MGRAKFAKGESVTFTAAKGGRRFQAVVTEPKIVRGNIAIQLTGDPYPVTVSASQVTKENENVPVSEARKLREEAKALGIRGWADMSGKDLAAAVAQAKSPKPKTVVASAAGAVKTIKENEKAAMSTTKKAPAKKVAAKKTAPAKKVAKKPVAAKKVAPKTQNPGPSKLRDRRVAAAKKAPANKVSHRAAPIGGNPFRPGSNLFKMAEELLKGGKRSDMIRRLRKTMGIHPWSKDKEENPEKAIDKRLLITAGTLKKDFGYTIQSDGRGMSGTLKVVPPAKKTAGQTAKSKASSSKTTKKAARRK